jgi:AcrR family transcriptional regulator
MASGNATSETLVSRAPRRERGRKRVTDLMAAAAALFVEKGYEATTMTEIAAHAGASIGSLYLFFPTKALLAQAMLTALADDLSARLEALQGRAAGWSAGAIADGLFDEMAAFQRQDPVYAVLIDVPGEDGWRQTIRARRRQQIRSLFVQAGLAERPAGAAGVDRAAPHSHHPATRRGTLGARPCRARRASGDAAPSSRMVGGLARLTPALAVPRIDRHPRRRS